MKMKLVNTQEFQKSGDKKKKRKSRIYKSKYVKSQCEHIHT